MAGRCWNQIKKPPNRSSFIEQKKELLVFLYSFLFVFDMLEEKNEDIVIFSTLCTKIGAYFLIFLMF